MNPSDLLVGGGWGVLVLLQMAKLVNNNQSRDGFRASLRRAGHVSVQAEALRLLPSPPQPLSSPPPPLPTGVPSQSEVKPPPPPLLLPF